MVATLFDGLTPQRYVWVSPNGSDQGTGSEQDPMKTIQAAVDIATAGTAIMVAAGEYRENVKLPTNAAGAPDKPIWLISADGPQAAKVVAADQTLSAIYGYGTDNYVVSGFEIEGGKRGIQFSQSGSTFTNLVNNIVVTGNVIHGTKEDAIKISQADNVHVVGNTVLDAAEEGIDFVAVNHSVIAYNDVANAAGAAGILAKGGSTDVLIANNHVHGIPEADGIVVGGWTETRFFRPGYTTYEAKDVMVAGNHVEDVARRPVNVLGAIDSKILDNYLVANPLYYAAIAVDKGSPNAAVPMYSANIEIANNIIALNIKLAVVEGSKNIAFHDNALTGEWTTQVGPDAYFTNSLVSTGTPVGDSLFGTAGSDTIHGLGSSDRLHGQAGADTINGGAGHDYLYGGLGADVLTGGGSYDHFVFNTALDGGVDRITDFSHGSDTIWFENGVFTALSSTGQLASAAFYSGPAAHDATDRFIYTPATGALSYDSDGNGAAAPVQVALLGTGLNVTAADLYVT